MAGTTGPTIVLPHGTAVTYSPAGLRVSERDRHGHELARLEWRADGALARASVRIPDGSWLEIQPRATADAPWGMSDRVWHRGAALTVFAAIDYARIAAIPPLADPTRLPPGGGTAVLNLLAGLAADQGCRRLCYRGPYPSEQLFLALLESFRPEPGPADPLGAFQGAELSWIPAPHERALGPEGIWIQMRGDVEKVVWRGRAYYQTAWHGIARHGARRVRRAGRHVLCSLWALGAVLEDHLRLDPEGTSVEILDVPPAADRVTIERPALLAGVAAAVAARSAPALGPSIAEAASELALEWGPVARDLVALDDNRLRMSTRLRARVQEWLRAARTSDEGLARGLAVVGELAHLAGDPLRARAQALLAGRPPEVQAAVVERGAGVDPAEIARAIAGAVRALRDGVQDQLDVEGDEGADRQR